MSGHDEQHLHVHLHFDHVVVEYLRHIDSGVHQLLAQGADMAATLDDVLAKVSKESTDIDSLNALIAGLKQQIADALSGVTLPPAVQAKVDAVFDGVSANDQKVVDALAANVTP